MSLKHSIIEAQMNGRAKKEEKARDDEIIAGRNIIDVKRSPVAVRAIKSSLMNLASSVARRKGMDGYLLVINPKITRDRLREEWAAYTGLLRDDIKRHVHLMIANGNTIEGIPAGFDENLRRRLVHIIEQERSSPRTLLLPKDNYSEIVKILIYHWIKNEDALAAYEIAKQAGCTYPTLSSALARLKGTIERGPKKSIRLSRFPLDEWSKLVSQSDRIRSTMWFADRSGRPRGFESLISRIRNLGVRNIAVGGVYGARFHYPNLDLVGNPQLAVSVHNPSRSADLQFVERLDPALQKIDSPSEPAALVVHFLRRTYPNFALGQAGLSIADPVECLLDLHEAHLESQAKSFLEFLSRSKSRTA